MTHKIGIANGSRIESIIEAHYVKGAALIFDVLEGNDEPFNQYDLLLIEEPGHNYHGTKMKVKQIVQRREMDFNETLAFLDMRDGYDTIEHPKVVEMEVEVE